MNTIGLRRNNKNNNGDGDAKCNSKRNIRHRHQQQHTRVIWFICISTFMPLSGFCMGDVQFSVLAWANIQRSMCVCGSSLLLFFIIAVDDVTLQIMHMHFCVLRTIPLTGISIRTMVRRRWWRRRRMMLMMLVMLSVCVHIYCSSPMIYSTIGDTRNA